MTQILVSRCTATTACGTLARRSKGGVLDLLLDPWRLLQCWRARIAYRRDLARLLATGPHLVRDLGLKEADVREEVRTPFWRA